VVLATDPISGAAIRATVKDLTQAESTVVVADEQTIVLGGLITKSTDHLERKVPWLGDLPLLGAAFRYDALITKRTELLIFLTPRIVKGHEYGEMLKQIEADRLHFTEFEAEQIHGPLYGIPAPSTGVGTDNWKTLTPPAPVPPAEGATPSVTPDDDSSAGLDGLKVPEAPAAAD